MARNETKFMECAIALAELLHFTHAAERVGISQPMLTKNIQDLESSVGGELFTRNRKTVALNDAGRAYVEQTRLALLYGDRAFQAARSVMQDADVVMNVGRSPYTDPFLTTMLLSLQLPLYPKLKIELASQFSCELANEVLAGALDLAIATEPPESALLTKVKITESPFYIAMSKHDPMAGYASVTLDAISGRPWILFERRMHPLIYDSVIRLAEQRKIIPQKIHHITMPEEAFPSVVDGSCVAFLVKAGALLLARNGVTVRPLAEAPLSMNTYLVSRADNKSKIVSELVRGFMRKLATSGGTKQQLSLPLHA